MPDQLTQLIAGLQAAYPAVKARVDGQAQQIADLQARVQQYEAGVPVEAITPTQVADLEAILASFQALAS